MSVTFTTAPVPAPNNTYSPANAVAVWVQGGGGAFVKTIGQWVSIRQPHLVAWQAAAGTADTDAVSGASRLNHTAPLTVIWNLRDRNGAVVPDGTYTIRLELAEGNSTAQGQNNQGTFTFVKGPTAQTQTNLANGNFTNVSINFDPNAVVCADGVVDSPEEKCDSALAAGQPGSCPSTCATADACMPVQLQGTAAACSAACVQLAPITACVNGDGCCAAGCSEADDDDCIPPAATTTTGGCSSLPASNGLLLLGFGLALALARRRR